MPEIHRLPNKENLQKYEKEMYEYAVAHPKEKVTNCDFIGLFSREYETKFGLLYLYGEYNETLCRHRKDLQTGKIVYGKYGRAEEFIKKYPQWKEVYYY